MSAKDLRQYFKDHKEWINDYTEMASEGTWIAITYNDKTKCVFHYGNTTEWDTGWFIEYNPEYLKHGESNDFGPFINGSGLQDKISSTKDLLSVIIMKKTLVKFEHLFD
jgi:hypothetical protein